MLKVISRFPTLLYKAMRELPEHITVQENYNICPVSILKKIKTLLALVLLADSWSGHTPLFWPPPSGMRWIKRQWRTRCVIPHGSRRGRCDSAHTVWLEGLALRLVSMGRTWDSINTWTSDSTYVRQISGNIGYYGYWGCVLTKMCLNWYLTTFLIPKWIRPVRKHMKVNVTTTPSGETPSCMLCCHWATGCQCGNVQRVASNTLKTSKFPSRSSLLLCQSLSYLAVTLTWVCLRAGRAGWLSGWLGVHGPKLWLE